MTSSPVYLQHHDVHRRVLRYDPAAGRHQELQREELPAGAALDWGFYVEHDGTPIGVYDAGGGAVLFRGAERYELRDPRCRLELDTEGPRRRFRLRWDGAPRFEVAYTPPPDVDTHPWDGPAMRDFFLWLVEQHGSP